MSCSRILASMALLSVILLAVNGSGRADEGEEEPGHGWLPSERVIDHMRQLIEQTIDRHLDLARIERPPQAGWSWNVQHEAK